MWRAHRHPMRRRSAGKGREAGYTDPNDRDTQVTARQIRDNDLPDPDSSQPLQYVIDILRDVAGPELQCIVGHRAGFVFKNRLSPRQGEFTGAFLFEVVGFAGGLDRADARLVGLGNGAVYRDFITQFGPPASKTICKPGPDTVG